MEIHAYDEVYIDTAVRILGDAFDYAVVTLGLDIDDFAERFVISGVSGQFEIGNPSFVAGMNGGELALLVIRDSGEEMGDTEIIMYEDKSPEFWSGYVLAYYQWLRNRSFEYILSVVKMSEIRNIYPAYHEMDIEHFLDFMDKCFEERAKQTRLSVMRKQLEMSQAELSRKADVPLRQIQLFEQRKRDINKTRALNLMKLSKALHCRMEELVE